MPPVATCRHLRQHSQNNVEFKAEAHGRGDKLMTARRGRRRLRQQIFQICVIHPDARSSHPDYISISSTSITSPLISPALRPSLHAQFSQSWYDKRIFWCLIAFQAGNPDRFDTYCRSRFYVFFQTIPDHGNIGYRLSQFLQYMFKKLRGTLWLGQYSPCKNSR